MKLVHSAVSNDIIYSYIQNSPAMFNLTSDQLIYLDHHNVDSKIVSAMMRHDRELRDQQYAAPNQTTVPPVTPPMPPTPDLTTNQPPATNPTPSEEEPYYYPQPESAAGPYDDTSQAAGYFYGSIAPYGSWYQLPGSGACWQPFACQTERNWRPYCNHGQWFFTDCGWFWNSYYPWGWACFHYGRWLNHPKLGWVWFPGKTWSPAWVTWRDSGKCIGWAPLPPGCGFGKSGLLFRNRLVPHGFGFGLRPNDFTFVSCQDFSSVQLSARRLDLTQATRVFPNTWAVNNFACSPDGRIINAGLDVNLLAADAREPILRARLSDANSPDRSGFFPAHSQSPAVVSVFRPDLLNHPQPTTRESLQAIPPPGSIFTPGLLDHPQPTSRESLSIPPITYPAVPSNTENPQNGSQPNTQPLRPNRQFPKVIINSGPPFAPAGTRPIQPRVGMGAPRLGSGFSSGGGHP